jgi:hypothetical protein
MIGLVLLQPQALGGEGARVDRVARQLDQPRRAAEGAGDLVGLALGGAVDAELGRADDAVAFIEHDHPAGWRGDADARDRAPGVAQTGEALAHRLVGRGDPARGVLFAVAVGQALDPGMGGRGLGGDACRFEVQSHHAGGGMTDFNSQEMHAAGCRMGVERLSGGARLGKLGVQDRERGIHSASRLRRSHRSRGMNSALPVGLRPFQAPQSAASSGRERF